MKGFMTLDTVTEELDDVELSYWEAVEDNTHDDHEESSLTSPHWSRVEQIMACKLYSPYIFVATELRLHCF